jgi:hypothetical protein
MRGAVAAGEAKGLVVVTTIRASSILLTALQMEDGAHPPRRLACH